MCFLAGHRLLFTVRERAEGVQPLRFRSTPLQKGETVHVIGWRYPDEGPQKILQGRYVKSERGSVLISVEELTDNTIPGLSGAPVIDAHGYLIGLMSTKSGKLQRLAGIDYPLAVLEQAGLLDAPSHRPPGLDSESPPAPRACASPSTS